MVLSVRGLSVIETFESDEIVTFGKRLSCGRGWGEEKDVVTFIKRNELIAVREIKGAYTE